VFVYYIVRKSRDYSVRVEADNEEEACSKAAKIPDDEWGVDVSELEAEEE
jgi:hypothetical protein